MSATVRISKRSHQILKRLSKKLGVSMVEALDQVTDDWLRREFLEGVNADYAKLKQDKAAWEDLLEERAAWDSTLMDGLEDDEHE